MIPASFELQRWALLAAAVWLLTGCECFVERDVEIERHCPPSKCESSCQCQPGDVCPAEPAAST